MYYNVKAMISVWEIRQDFSGSESGRIKSKKFSLLKKGRLNYRPC